MWRRRKTYLVCPIKGIRSFVDRLALSWAIFGNYLRTSVPDFRFTSGNFGVKKDSSKNAQRLDNSVPGAGIEPAQPLGPRDFKSLPS